MVLVLGARDGDTPRVPKVEVGLGWEGSCHRGCSLLGGDASSRRSPKGKMICNCPESCLLAFSGSPFTLAPDLLCLETQEAVGGKAMHYQVAQVSAASVSISLTLRLLCFLCFLIKEFCSLQDNLHILPTGGAGKGLQ